MYRIIGGDGKEYGPVPLETIKQWVQEGRIGPRTRIQGSDSTEWRSAPELPELSNLFPSRPVEPAPVVVPPQGEPQKGLAITSFVLGLLSMVCFAFLTGIPAIICGHIAHNRARRQPGQYGGAGFAIAGFVMGYVSLLFSLVILPAMLLPALATAKNRAQVINCSNNMKQIGVALKIWAIDHDDQFPFNVSTNKGGTLELSSRSPDGFDPHAYLHFQVISNELNALKLLTCPGDSSKTPASDWAHLKPGNVSYQLRTGPEVDEKDPSAILSVCPIHGNKLHVDGSVETKKRTRRSRTLSPNET
jgi:hypothetical protein